MKRIILNLLAGLSLAMPALALAPVYAAPSSSDASKQQVCQGIGLTEANCTDNSGENGVIKLIKAVIEILSIVIGIAAVIMIIVAGLSYVTSGGDSNSVASAKNTLIYALVGIVVAALAQVLVRFVLNEVK